MIYKAIVIGCSAGGLNALSELIPKLPASLTATVIIVQHIKPYTQSFLPEYLDKRSILPVKEAIIREKAEEGCVYIAPPGYHLLIEEDQTFSLNVDQRVSYAIPSIDVLFESAAFAYTTDLIGVILTGANSDGSEGLSIIKKYGGLTIAQDPATAESPMMPTAALKTTEVDHIASLEKISELLIEYATANNTREYND